jgi:hypothetical protein
MHPSSGTAIAVYAAAVVVLLVVWTFRLDELLVRRRKPKGPQVPEGQHFHTPNSRLMDPHSGGSATGPAKPRPRPRVIE